jgi:integrase
MRPRQQAGQVCKRGSNWVLRFHEDRMTDGKVKRVRTLRPLAPIAKYKTERDVRIGLADKIAAILNTVNAQDGGEASASMTLGEFIELQYFPRLEFRLKVDANNALHIEPSTVEGYRDIWKVHVKESPIVKIGLRDFNPRDGQRFMETLPQHLSHQTHLRIKNFLRGVFTFATQEAGREYNPMGREVAAYGRTKDTETDRRKLSEREKKIRASNVHAYTLEEVAEMLDKLPEPARTVCAVAAFTGLTRSELRGLKWSDYDGETINVQRKIWNDHIGAPKTEAREAGVYVIGLLRKILAKYKTAFPSVGEGWIFRGEKMLRPLDLDNLSRRDIPQYINGAWFGWHAFRRGLATRLKDAGVPDKDIQSILRHADISTTQAHYIKSTPEASEAAMKKLAKVAQSKYGIRA